MMKMGLTKKGALIGFVIGFVLALIAVYVSFCSQGRGLNSGFSNDDAICQISTSTAQTIFTPLKPVYIPSSFFGMLVNPFAEGWQHIPLSAIVFYTLLGAFIGWVIGKKRQMTKKSATGS